jgi:hypothetical protein
MNPPMYGFVEARCSRGELFDVLRRPRRPTPCASRLAHKVLEIDFQKRYGLLEHERN